MNSASLVTSPFKFLDPYTAQDTERFFGRQKEQNRLVELVFSSRLILVYGLSGTGKSSLVQCGLAKAIAPTDYFPIIVRRRGDLPTALVGALQSLLEEETSTDVDRLLADLTEDLLRPVYLIFDQFEELFISGSPSEQAIFFAQLKTLYQSKIACKLLLVMREDYIAHLNPFEEQLPSLFDFRLRVEPMSNLSLEEVILGTFGQEEGVDLQNDKETAQIIIHNNQVGKNSYQLPYLQVYLDRLWRLGQKKQIEEASSKIRINPILVEEIGRIDNVLEQFLTEQQEIVTQRLPGKPQGGVRKVLEAFVTYEGTRQEHSLDSLELGTGLEPAILSGILQELERSRILREEESTYELSHDSLARVIDQGRTDEQRQINSLMRRLKEDYNEYKEKTKLGGAQTGDDVWLTARRLTEVQLYEKNLQEELKRTETNSLDIWKYVKDSESARNRQRRRKTRQLQRTIAGVTVLFLLAVASSIFAVQQWNRSNYQSLIFLANQLPPLDALDVLGWVWKESGNERAEAAIYERLYNGKGIYRILPTKGEADFGAFSPDSQLVLTGAYRSNKAYLWDFQGELLDSLVHDYEVWSGVFSPDGQQILTGSRNGAYLWNLNGECLDTLEYKCENGGVVRSVEFSPDGRRIMLSGYELLGNRTEDEAVSKTYLWDTDGQLLDSLILRHILPMRTTFSPDGQHILISDSEYIIKKSAFLWDLASGKLDSLRHKREVSSAVFSPDGQHIMTCDFSLDSVQNYKGNVYLWDLQGNLLDTLIHNVGGYTAQFSPNGKQIITRGGTASMGNNVYIWDRKGNLLDTLQQTEWVDYVSYSPDGKWILVGCTGMTYLWNYEMTSYDLLEYPKEIHSAVFSPGGNQLLAGVIDTISRQNSVYLWNTELELLNSLNRPWLSLPPTFTPDGQKILTDWFGRWILISNLEGDPLDTLLYPVNAQEYPGRSELQSVVFSPDGQRILGSFDNVYDNSKRRAYIWDQHGKLLDSLEHSGAVFSPDGRRILGGFTREPFNTNQIYIWDQHGKLLDSLSHLGEVKSAVFSPDGKYIITSSDEPDLKTHLPIGRIYLWDSKGDTLKTFFQPERITSAVFSPDGQSILTNNAGVSSGIAYRWSLDGQLLNKFVASYLNSVFIKSIFFSPDGAYVMAIGQNTDNVTNKDKNIIYLWSANGQLKQTFRSNEEVKTAVFTPDTRYLQVVSGNKVYKYPTPNAFESTIRNTLKKQHTIYTSFWEAAFSEIKAWLKELWA